MTADQPAPSAEIPPELAGYVERLNAWAGLLGAVRPTPVTFRVQATTASHDGKMEGAVEIWAAGPTGVTVHTVPPELADELAGMLREHSRIARTGLTIAKG